VLNKPFAKQSRKLVDRRLGGRRKARPLDSPRLAPGALSRLFGEGNEDAGRDGHIFVHELIREDSERRPDLYPELAKSGKSRNDRARKPGRRKMA
jgi:hypothetical protein